MGQQIEELARFVAATRWQDVPEPVRRHAKLTLLDTLGVILAGGERPRCGNCASAWPAPSGRAPRSMRAAGPSRIRAPPQC